MEFFYHLVEVLMFLSRDTTAILLEKNEQMKKLTNPLVGLILLTVLFSCGSGAANQPATAEGFSKIEEAVKDKFGDEAYFTDLTVTYVESIGNVIGVTVTEDPESLKMGQWNQTQGAWTQNSDISLELPAGTKASNFMFQLNDEINLTKLGELIETSKEKLTSEKGLENPRLSMASVLFPDNGQREKTKYWVNLEPENGGTSFSFYYNLAGEFLNMSY